MSTSPCQRFTARLDIARRYVKDFEPCANCGWAESRHGATHDPSQVAAQGIANSAPYLTWAARLLFDDYNWAWATLGSGSAFHRALELRSSEAFELAAWGLLGARRVVEARA